MKHYRSITEMRRDKGLPPPEHPLIGLFKCTSTCPLGDLEFTGDFYILGLKKLRFGEFIYGRTKYDHSNGCLSFTKPRQQVQLRHVELEEEGFFIFIHEDFLNGHLLRNEIDKYSFFDYEVNEALHLSPTEEKYMWGLYEMIEAECHNNLDEFSRNIMLTHLHSMLRYAERFYKRQFIHRSEVSGRTASKFDRELRQWFISSSIGTEGLPTVRQLAAQLNMSPHYLSDVLRQETGKTALELIHLFLIGEAKNRLTIKEKTISEIAFDLGFDSLSYFSRLFKRETGVSPKQYKQSLN